MISCAAANHADLFQSIHMGRFSKRSYNICKTVAHFQLIHQHSCSAHCRTHMDGLKKVCVVGGGTGNALAYPLATGMHDHGIEVDMIGARSVASCSA